MELRKANVLLMDSLERSVKMNEKASIAIARLIIENAELRETVKELKGRLGIAE